MSPVRVTFFAPRSAPTAELRRAPEALGGPGAAPLGLDLAVTRRRCGNERVEQSSSRLRDLVDGAVEGLDVRAGGLLHAAHLADVLKRRVAHLLGGCGRSEVVKRSDVPTHASERSR